MCLFTSSWISWMYDDCWCLLLLSLCWPDQLSSKKGFTALYILAMVQNNLPAVVGVPCLPNIYRSDPCWRNKAAAFTQGGGEPLSPGCERSELHDDDLVNELWCRFCTVSRHWKKVPRINEETPCIPLQSEEFLEVTRVFQLGWVMLGWKWIVQLLGFSIIAVGDGPLFE